MTLAGYARTASDLRGVRASPRESARFGFDISRLEIADAGVADPDRVLRWFEESGSEVCFLRYPASEVGWLAELGRSDATALVADTLLYFRRSRPDALPEGREADILGPGDLELLDAAVRSTFSDYPNHYRSNPILGRAQAESGYVEWARSLVSATGSAVLWSGDRDDPAGFGAVHTTGPEGEIVLAGVLPSARGKGAYDRLMADLEGHLWAEGAQHVVISTQAWNLVPMRVWVRRGYLPHAAFTTVHLMRGAARERYLEAVAV